MKVKYLHSENEVTGIMLVTETELDRRVIEEILEGTTYIIKKDVIMDGEDYGIFTFESGKPILVDVTLKPKDVKDE